MANPSDFGGDFGPPDFAGPSAPPAIAGVVQVLIANPFVYYPTLVSRPASDTKPPKPRYLVGI